MRISDWSSDVCSSDLLQVDGGMARLGLAPPELDRLRSDRLLEGVDLRFIASHLARADDASHPANAAQREHFLAAAALFPDVPRTLGNSAAALTAPAGRFDLVRPGIGLYGANPLAAPPNPMRPVVQLTARIAQLREVPAGAGVGYGHAFIAARASRMAPH